MVWGGGGGAHILLSSCMGLEGVCSSVWAIEWASTQKQQNVTPTLSCSALRPKYGQPGMKQRLGQCARTHARAHTNTHTQAGVLLWLGRFFPVSPHRGSIKCLVHVCCPCITLTDTGMNDLFGRLFNCQRWMAPIRLLSLMINQAIYHFKQIYPAPPHCRGTAPPCTHRAR